MLKNTVSLSVCFNAMKFSFAYIVVNALVLLCVVNGSTSQNSAFDFDLYQNVLDPDLCERQLTYIRNNDTSIRNRFIDASWRIPRSILKGNTRDLGNYFQCLEINENVLNTNLGGKYCIIEFPLQQDINLLTLPDTWAESSSPELVMGLPWKEFELKRGFLSEDLKAELNRYERTRLGVRNLLGGRSRDSNLPRSVDGALSEMSFELAVCIPKACTSRQALDFFTDNLTSNLVFSEQFCRLPNDKTWVAADTVAVVLLSIIGLLTILSTAYDIRHTAILQKDPKKVNKVYQSFSIYTNTKNFFVFPSGGNIVTCLDGIRSFAMMWVIVGHTFGTQFSFIPENPLDAINFMVAFTSLWLTSGTITVDTFFLLSGLLVVYTTAAKVSRRDLFKNLHLFYLNRLLRMFPVLAFSALMTASFLYRTVDGPYFNTVASLVNDCREYWWTTLLYVQNFAYEGHICVPHSWYLAIDMQLYFISPLVLFWVLGQSKRSAWLAMGTTLVAVLAGASVYNFINNFASAIIPLSRPLDAVEYNQRYYIHTLPRAAPFFVGMIYGYLLHLYRMEKPRMPKVLVLFLWVLAFAGTTGVCVATYWNIQVDWDNQVMDNIFNSYKRTIWVACVGWLIFACHNGYGGPINWILSLHIFKILGRLSYAMYILHYLLIVLINATTLSPIYFTVHFSLYRFLIDFSLAVIAAFLLTITIDYPFANLIKIGLNGFGRKSASKPDLQ